MAVTGAAFALVWSVFTNDFSITYILEHSNRALPIPYKFAALWSGQEGSLLLWAWLLGTYGFVLRLRHKTVAVELFVIGIGDAREFRFILSTEHGGRVASEVRAGHRHDMRSPIDHQCPHDLAEPTALVRRHMMEFVDSDKAIGESGCPKPVQRQSATSHGCKLRFHPPRS